MKRSGLALFAVLALAALASAPSAQQTPAPPMFYVHQEVVKPSMLAEAEAAAKEFVATMKQYGLPFHFQTVSTSELDYYYVLPIKGFADIDRINTMFATLAEKMGKAKFDEFMRKGSAHIDHTVEWVVAERPDLSYQPASPRLKPEEIKYVRYDFIYIRPGEESTIEEISKEWVALYASKNIPDGYTTYQPVMGPDLPLMVYATTGSSAADIEASAAKTEQALGAEGAALIAKTLPIVRRIEIKMGQLRPELSNPAPATSSAP